jgi:histidine triad (HIT) family protein
MKCIFCEIVKNKVESFKVWENNEFVIKLDINPIQPGHILLIPKKHSIDVFTMPNQDFVKLFILAKKVALRMKPIFKAGRIGLAIEGFGIEHSHIHLVPVNKGNELNPLKAKKASIKKLKKQQDVLIRKFKTIKID